MSESVPSILAKTPRKAYGYLLIFAIAEITWNAMPFPRTDLVGNLVAATFFIGAIALSLFLKSLPIGIRAINRATRKASLVIAGALIGFVWVISAISIDWVSRLFSYVLSSLLMVFFATVICAIRTSRPDLMLKEEDEEKEKRQREQNKVSGHLS